MPVAAALATAGLSKRLPGEQHGEQAPCPPPGACPTGGAVGRRGRHHDRNFLPGADRAHDVVRGRRATRCGPAPRKLDWIAVRGKCGSPPAGPRQSGALTLRSVHVPPRWCSEVLVSGGTSIRQNAAGSPWSTASTTARMTAGCVTATVRPGRSSASHVLHPGEQVEHGLPAVRRGGGVGQPRGQLSGRDVVERPAPPSPPTSRSASARVERRLEAEGRGCLPGAAGAVDERPVGQPGAPPPAPRPARSARRPGSGPCVSPPSWRG